MSDLAIRSIRRFLVRVPVRTPIVWGSGVRTGVTRMLVELTTEGGIVGWGETICLLDAIPRCSTRSHYVAIGRRSTRPSRCTGTCWQWLYHHKRAAVWRDARRRNGDVKCVRQGAGSRCTPGGGVAQKIEIAACFQRPGQVMTRARSRTAASTFKWIGYDERPTSLTRRAQLIGPTRRCARQRRVDARHGEAAVREARGFDRIEEQPLGDDSTGTTRASRDLIALGGPRTR
jgi:hypothetical protein